jgi:uncharacterized lipoprotein YmbA
MKRALCLLLLALGCSRSAPVRMYALAESAGTRVSYSGPPVRLEAVNLPPESDDNRMLRHTSSYELTTRDNELWSAPLPYLMRQTIARDLATRLPEGAVVYPDAPRPAGTVSLVVHVLTLDEHDGKLSMTAAWTYLGIGTAGILARGEKQLSAPVDGTGESTSAALSKLSGELADAMVASAATLSPQH